MGCYRVRQPGWFADLADRADRILGDFLGKRRIGFERRLHPAHQCFLLGIDRDGFAHLFDLHHEEGFSRHETPYRPPPPAFHEHLDVAVRKIQELDDAADCAVDMDVVLPGIVGLRVFLCSEENVPAAVHRCLKGMNRLFPAHEEGQNHVGEDGNIA